MVRRAVSGYDKEAHSEANRPALMKGASRKAAAERKKRGLRQ